MQYTEVVQRYTFSTVMNMARAMSGAQNDIGVAAFEVYRLLLRVQNRTLSARAVLDVFEQRALNELEPVQAQVYALFLHAFGNVVG